MRSFRIALLLLLSNIQLKGQTGSQITDAAGNLQGDLQRAWLDIIHVKTSPKEDEFELSLKTLGAFPAPSQLLGKGGAFVIRFGSNDQGENKRTLMVTVTLNASGWSVDSEQVEMDILLSSFKNKLTLKWRSTDLTPYDWVEFYSTTEKFPKWRPVTFHPILKLSLKASDIQASEMMD